MINAPAAKLNLKVLSIYFISGVHFKLEEKNTFFSK